MYRLPKPEIEIALIYIAESERDVRRSIGLALIGLFIFRFRIVADQLDIVGIHVALNGGQTLSGAIALISVMYLWLSVFNIWSAHLNGFPISGARSRRLALAQFHNRKPGVPPGELKRTVRKQQFLFSFIIGAPFIGGIILVILNFVLNIGNIIELIMPLYTMIQDLVLNTPAP